jgi:hypothetical protein
MISSEEHLKELVDIVSQNPSQAYLRLTKLLKNSPFFREDVENPPHD